MPRKTFLLLYLMSLLIVYIFLVIDNLVWNLYDGNYQNVMWSFITEFTNWQDIFTIFSLGLFLTLILRNRIIKDFIYPFGMIVIYLVLGINKVLWNINAEFYETILSIFLFEQNWITMFIGAFIFLFYYRTFKKVRR
jgi:uncharacterized membrane protein